MATEWMISSIAERVGLTGENRGETSFTVTNPGSVPDRVVFEVVAGDGADGSWFRPPDEPQLLVAAGGSATFLVKIVVPPGAAAGSYWLQGRAYSADTAPEEGSRLSTRVAFDVAPSVEPRKPWWPYAVAASVVVVVLAVVGYLVFRPEPPPPPPGYPSDPRAYAEAVLAAWGGRQSARLADLTSAQANDKVNAIPGPPNTHWTFVDCDGAAGSSYCTFYNDSGDTIVVRLGNEQLGSPHAATDAMFHGLPEDGVAYAREFVDAWQRADHARMLQLSTPGVVGAVTELAAAPTNPTFTVVAASGGLLVVRVSTSQGLSLRLHIGTTLLGQQHAVVGYE